MESSIDQKILILRAKKTIYFQVRQTDPIRSKELEAEILQLGDDIRSLALLRDKNARS